MDNNNQNKDPNKRKRIQSAIIMLVICLGITVFLLR